MMYWSFVFLIVALVAAFLGFGDLAAISTDMAQVVFFIALVLFVVGALVGLVRRKSPKL